MPTTIIIANQVSTVTWKALPVHQAMSKLLSDQKPIAVVEHDFTVQSLLCSTIIKLKLLMILASGVEIGSMPILLTKQSKDGYGLLPLNCANMDSSQRLMRDHLQ